MTAISAPPAGPTWCPYLGLVPFSEEHEAFFFGRERDSGLIVDNLIAYRLTLLYGPSGVGKSSVLGAGVVPALRRQTDLGPQGPTGLVVTFNSWRDDPMGPLDDAIEAVVGSAGSRPAAASDRRWPLWQRLQHWSTELNADFYFILDQFEEYFLYHGDPDEPFAVRFADIVTREDVPAHFLLAVREDAIAKLDRFQERIPNVFENYYRLEHLRVDEARAAIVGPVEEFNRRVGEPDRMAIEPSLIDEVVDQVRTGRVQVGTAGEGRLDTAADDAVETAHLQLVMTRLWGAERDDGSRVLRTSTLQRLGGAASIVRTHLDASMALLSEHDQSCAASVFRQLVTPSGTKIAHRADDLAAYASVSSDELTPVLERLSGRNLRVLRPIAPAPDRPDAARYEIFHDALAGAVLEWRQRHERSMRERETQAQLADAQATVRRERRRRMLMSMVAVLLVGLLTATILLFLHSRRQGQRRRSEQLASQALAELEGDPTRATRTALAAWDQSHTKLAETALRRTGSRLQVEFGLSGHTDSVSGAVFSPDGSRVLTVSEDRTARLWDAQSGAELATIRDHTGSVTGGRFGDDGELIVTWSDDQTVRVWDGRNGEPVVTLADHTDDIMDARFSPDGRLVLTASLDGTALVWDAREGRVLHNLDHGAGVTASAFIGEGAEVVTGDVNGRVRVWSVMTGLKLATMQPGPRTWSDAWVSTLAVSPDGNAIAAGSGNAGVVLWRWREPAGVPANLRFAELGDRELLSASFSPDGSRLAAVTDKWGFLWEVPATPEEVAPPVRLDGHIDWVVSAAFSKDGEFLVTASQDGTAIVRDGASGGFLTELRGHAGAVSSAEFDLGGRILTASSDGTARLWQAPAARLFRGHTDWVIDADLTEDESRVVSGGTDGAVWVWDRESGEEVAHIGGDTSELNLGAINRVALHRDGRHVATASAYGTVAVWDLQGDLRQPVHEWADDDGLFDVAFDPAGDTLAVGALNGVVHLWRWTTTEPVTSLPVAGAGAVAVAWSPRGDRLATGTGDGSVRIWDPVTLEEVKGFQAHEDSVLRVGFSPDGDRLVTSSDDRTARVWDANSWDPDPVALLRGHDARVSSAAFGPSSDRVVTGAADGTVGLWDAGTGNNLALFRAHASYVNSVRFLADGRVLSAGDDNVVRLYPCQTCQGADELAAELARRLERVPQPAPRVPSPDMNATNVGLGTCLPADDDEGPVVRLTPTSCDQEHESEVFAILQFPDGPDAAYPGSDPVLERAQTLCAAPFEAYVGTSPAKSMYIFSSFTPTEASWASGERQVICTLGSPEGPTTGSARNSNQ